MVRRGQAWSLFASVGVWGDAETGLRRKCSPEALSVSRVTCSTSQRLIVTTSRAAARFQVDEGRYNLELY